MGFGLNEDQSGIFIMSGWYFVYCQNQQVFMQYYPVHYLSYKYHDEDSSYFSKTYRLNILYLISFLRVLLDPKCECCMAKLPKGNYTQVIVLYLCVLKVCFLYPLKRIVICGKVVCVCWLVFFCFFGYCAQLSSFAT